MRRFFKEKISYLIHEGVVSILSHLSLTFHDKDEGWQISNKAMRICEVLLRSLES